jgi:hypothetical protein
MVISTVLKILYSFLCRKYITAGCCWLMPVILPTQEAEIRSTEVQSQSWQIVREILSRKYPAHKRVGGVAQGINPKFKL